jgi:4-hydroxymandelate oxidase
MKDQRIDESILRKGAGNMERFLALHEFEPEARQRLPRAVYEYVAGGAGEEYSIRANEESYQRIFLRPRVLRSVGPVDLGQELFGRPLPAPVLLAPAAYQRLMHPDGELGSVRGAIRHAVPFVLSSNATVSIEEIMTVPGARCWFQIYVQGDRGFTRDSIARVEAADCEAVCVTVDTPVLGLRPRQMRAGFSIPAEVPLPHAARLRAASDPGRHSALTWRDVDWLRSVVKSKLLLKGILHPADAELAIRAGVDGIMVSNHGGRNLDTVIPPIEALPDITQQVAGRVPLLVPAGTASLAISSGLSSLCASSSPILTNVMPKAPPSALVDSAAVVFDDRPEGLLSLADGLGLLPEVRPKLTALSWEEIRLALMLDIGFN